MFFQNNNQKQLFTKLKELLTTNYGQKHVNIQKDKDGVEISFRMIRGSADIQIFPYSFKKTESMVTLLAILTFQTPYSPELADWIVKINPKITFGGFGFVEYKDKPGIGNVVLYYDMLGKTVTSDELYNALDNASWLADKWDDHIVEDFGGLTNQMSYEQMQKEKQQNPPQQEKENWE